jgi:phthiocerol/phenolphthiocerol synthesis type-I polyketide synthase D
MITVAELESWLVGQVAEACEVEPDEIDRHKPLDEYGFSSRDAVELSGELEDLLDRSLSTTLLWEHPTIERLAKALTAGDDEVESAPEPAPAADPIAVVGLGCRLPGGTDGPAGFWRLLDQGGEAISEVAADRWADYGDTGTTTRWGGFLDDVAGFDAEFFGIVPREAARMDPQQRMVLEVAWEALEHAGIAPRTLRGSRTGVFVGISGTEYGSLSLADLEGVDAWVGTGAALAIAANRLSYALDLRGPSMAIDTACSSSLTAVHLAVQSLRSGESDLALVGGANLLLGPAVTANFDEMGISSADGKCKPFSAGADGIVRAEGAGVVVLKRLSQAQADGDRVLALIRGSATNSDGRSNGLTAPNPEAQQALLRTAYRNAGVDPSTVDYVEAHGTGTLLGDPIEASALGAVLGAGRVPENPLLLGSVKSNLGHLEAAAGIVGLIKVVLALDHGRIPASLNYTGANPHIDFDELRLSVVDSARTWPSHGRPAIAGVSGFGFGGTNAHVVLEQAETTAVTPPSTGHRRFLLAAPDKSRLADTAGKLAGWLAKDGTHVPLADLDHTLARRLDGSTRAVVVARDAVELASGLRDLAAGGEAGVVPAGAPAGDIVFVFSGHGSQWAGMGRRLLADEPVFADAVGRLDPLIRAESGFSLLEDLRDGVEASTMDHVQPLVFGIQLALAELWASHGVRPAAVIGHSFGEVTAAVVTGALSEADGAKIVSLRSRLLASLAGDGAMALLELAADEAGKLVDGLSDVDVAVLSAPNQTVIAGRGAQVRELVAEVEGRGLLAKLINLDVAAHSPIVDNVTGTLADALTDLRPGTADIRFYSTALVDPREAPGFGAGYWARNLRQPVRFAGAVAAALADGYRTFLEISPHPVLRHALTDNIEAVGSIGTRVLSSLRNCADETAHFHSQLGMLELASETPPARVEGSVTDLPGTPWRHVRHWLPKPAASAVPSGRHPLLGTHIEIPGGLQHVWSADLGSTAVPWLSEHSWDTVPALPGAVCLELAAAAAREVFDAPAERITVGSVTIHRPLALGKSTPVTTSLTPTKPGHAEVTVHAKDSEGWRLHASAEVSLSTASISDTYLSEVDTSGFSSVPLDDVYGWLNASGLGYGPALRGMNAPRASADGVRATAQVSLPETVPRAAQVVLHPSLVESCLQLFAVALFRPGRNNAPVHLPREFGTIRVYGDLAAAELAHVSVAEQTGRLIGELHVTDGRGRVLLEATDVVLREFSPEELAPPLTDRLQQPVWRPVPAPATQPAEGRVLLLGHESASMASALTARGIDALTDRAALGDPALRSVVLLLPEEGRGLEALAEAERAVLTISEITRELIERPSGAARLLLVTTGATTGVSPAFAALRGLVRVLAYEHPDLGATIVDLEAASDREESALRLVRELATAADDEVAWRDGERHASRLEWTASPAADTFTTPLTRADGGYVITGGLGGLGLHIARWLAADGAGKLVLNGRSAPKAAALAAIDAMTAAGTEVQVVLGDIAEPGVAERLMEAAGSESFTPRGVLHAAAVFDDRTTIQLDADTLHRTWLPKAYGAWRLHEATQDLELDWWAGFSSVAGLHGFPGQPAYSSANAYVDAIVSMRRAQGLPAASVAWGAWAEIGAASELDIPWLTTIGPAEGMAVLSAVLRGTASHTGAIRLRASALAATFPHLTEVPFFETVLGGYATTARTSGQWMGLDNAIALSPAEARAVVSTQLLGRIASVLGFDPGELDTVSPLSALGVDSLLAVRIRNAVQHDFGLALPVSLMLRGGSVADTEHWLFGELGLASAEAPVRQRRPAPPIGPRDAAERLVASAWRDVLGVDIGVTQDFYGVGGSREKAEQVTALLAERSGRELTISELFEHPSIERMAEHLREEEHGGSPLRVLRERGTVPPLFFFHPGGGDTAVYRQLAQLLDPGVGVYGFDRIEGVSSVEDRVREYLPVLREVQPHGPYRLAGWSFGGFLAYEMAQQLRNAGEEVELVALIDSIIPLPNDSGLSDVELLAKRFERFGEFLEASYGARLELPFEKMARLDDEEQVQLLVDTMRDSGLINNDVSQAILHHQRTSFLDTRSLERYCPEAYPGPVTFYSAAESIPGGLRDHRFDRTDPARGWDQVCADLDVVVVPGHHLSLLDPPNVDTIGRHLGTVLVGARLLAGVWRAG